MAKHPPLVLATLNPGKVHEFRSLFKDTGIEIESLIGRGIALPKEGTAPEGATLKSNAALKAEAICTALGCWALADDSGLFVEALDGAPGVDTATYGGPAVLLNTMGGIVPSSRMAEFRCTLALARPRLPTMFFEGRAPGQIALEQQGQGGFGYDSVFIPAGQSLTCAQAVDIHGIAAKADDHRGRAIRQFLATWPTLIASGA
jgi:XTP/dITP diphosphohydrolase